MSSKKANPSFRILRSMAAVTALSGLLAGCVGLGGPSDPVRFYTLDEPVVVSESPVPGASQVMVGLDEVVLPSYLAGKEIAVRLGNNEIRYSTNNRWAERPVHAVTRFLEHAVAVKSDVVTEVVSVPWPDRAEPVRVLSIEVIAMEAQEKPSAEAKLHLKWEIRSGDDQQLLKRGEYELNDDDWSAKDYAGLMEVFSEGLEQAAGLIAQDVESSLTPGE